MKVSESKASSDKWTRIELLDPLETSVLISWSSILTVSFYRLENDSAPIDWVRDRVKQIVYANP
eukprot:scaffold594132_cov45-Prasinocladus_malaysianus.AAC.1